MTPENTWPIQQMFVCQGYQEYPTRTSPFAAYDEVRLENAKFINYTRTKSFLVSSMQPWPFAGRVNKQLVVQSSLQPPVAVWLLLVLARQYCSSRKHHPFVSTSN